MKHFSFIIRYTMMLCALLLMASCDSDTYKNLYHQHGNSGLEIKKTTFSADYRRITLEVNMTKDLGTINLKDSAQATLKVSDTYCRMTTLIKVAQPKITSVNYVAPERIKKTGLIMLVLVDLSQPSAIMKQQQDYIKKIYSLFSKENLYLAFMKPDGTVSTPMVATDYIVDNYISVQSPLLGGLGKRFEDYASVSDTTALMPQKKHAFLYRSVSQMLFAFSGHTGTAFDNARYKSLVIFSDGQVYDEVDNTPLDPQHFTMQERLINQSANLPSNASVYYVNLHSANINSAVKDNNMMRMLCMRTNGKFQNSFDWNALRNDILKNFSIGKNDYVIELENPSGKVLLGNIRDLKLTVYKPGTKNIIARCVTSYSIGDVDEPVIVGGTSYAYVFFAVLLIVASTILVVYIILQMVVPFIRYRIFRNKYVVNYTGQNMSVQGKIVADTCYFCKAPFRIGDTIVARCQHTMHEECWMENDQHCPEYGTHCPDGGHYYDANNLYNPQNGSYIIKWILPAIVVSWLSWLLFIITDLTDMTMFIDSCCSWLRDLKPDVVDQELDVQEYTDVMTISPHMYILPLVSFYLVPSLTLLFSGLASYHRQWRYRIMDMVTRAVIVLCASYVIFLLEFFIIYISDMYDSDLLFDWIPWTLITYIVMLASTKNTRIHDMHSRTMIITSLALGITNAVIWEFLGSFETVTEMIFFIYLFIIYGAVLSCVIARKLPVSEHYFLRAKGEMKEMDIALYKWLRQTPDAFVTIGRSVDCQLQISWDTTSDISPRHAIIRLHAGVPYITPLDGDVIVGMKAIPEGKSKRLYHGMTFQIGTTLFTFIEA